MSKGQMLHGSSYITPSDDTVVEWRGDCWLSGNRDVLRGLTPKSEFILGDTDFLYCCDGHLIYMWSQIVCAHAHTHTCSQKN